MITLTPLFSKKRSGSTVNRSVIIFVRRIERLTDANRMKLGHCGMGMVGSINAPLNGSNTFDAFVAAAKAIGPNNEATVSVVHCIMPTG
jgi:hypothetical protein